MLNVGQTLLRRDAPQSEQYRYCMFYRKIWLTIMPLKFSFMHNKIDSEKVLVSQISSITIRALYCSAFLNYRCLFGVM